MLINSSIRHSLTPCITLIYNLVLINAYTDADQRLQNFLMYDQYRSIVNTMPELIDNQDVARAMEIAEDVRRDKLKRNALAKEAMAGRRINKLLTALRGQWHIIDLHDNITRKFLINNTNEFFEALISGINWPENVNHLPYKSLSSGSHYQYILEKEESSRSGKSGESEERNK